MSIPPSLADVLRHDVGAEQIVGQAEILALVAATDKRGAS